MSSKNKPTPLIPHLRRIEASAEAVMQYRRLETLILDNESQPIIWTLCIQPKNADHPLDRRHYVGYLSGGVMLMFDPSGSIFIQTQSPWRCWSDYNPELSRPAAFSPRFPIRPLPALNRNPPVTLALETARHLTVNVGYSNCDMLCASLGTLAAGCLRQYLYDAGKKPNGKLPLIELMDN